LYFDFFDWFFESEKMKLIFATPMIQDFLFKGNISNLSSIEEHRSQMIQFINQFFNTNSTA
jgi:Tfp pilus assembly ATPase PilU